MLFAVDRLDHLVLNVRDVDIAASWYERVLGMEVESFGRDNRTALKFGGQKINLRPVDMDPYTWVTAREPTAGSDDLCFISAAPIPEVIAHLYECKVAIELGPVEREGALGPMTSVYCRDPDGNLIEIASYLPRA
jgi:catechol 2,3-dioxygenase-like lactoylglutathione lyase family enzyme